MSEKKKKSFDLESELLKNAIPVNNLPDEEEAAEYEEEEEEEEYEEEEEEEEEEDDEEDDEKDDEKEDEEDEEPEGAPKGSVRSGYVAEAVPTVDLSDEALASGMKVESLAARTARKELWTREVDRSSHGASHVKTFIGKLTREAIAYMDEQINTWLENNPEVEVKLVTVVQGDIIGRTREPSLLVSVWV